MTIPFESHQIGGNVFDGANTSSPGGQASPPPPRLDNDQIAEPRAGNPPLPPVAVDTANVAQPREIWATSAPQSSLRFRGPSFVQPRRAGSPSPSGMGTSFAGAKVITMAFWLRPNAMPGYEWVAPVALHRYGGMWCRLNASGTVQFAASVNNGSSGVELTTSPASVPALVGIDSHWLAVLDCSIDGKQTLTVYRNGVLAMQGGANQSGSNSVQLAGGYSILCLGNFYPPGPGSIGADIQLADVAIWNGYAGTLEDSIALTNGDKRPSDIATPQRAIYLPGDGGTAGADVGATDAGILNAGLDANFSSNEGFTYSLGPVGGGTGNSVQGSLQYDNPLSYTPPVLASPYISGSGEGIWFGFRTRVGAKAHIPPSTTRNALFGPGGAPVLTIHRAGGGTNTATLGKDYAYFSNATSADEGNHTGQDFLYFDLLGQGVARIGPGDTVHVSAGRNWVGLSEGQCAELDADAARTSPLPAIPAGRKAMRAGYNLMQPSGYNLPYYGNLARWMDGAYGWGPNGLPDWGMVRDANGMPRPGLAAAGSYAEGLLLTSGGLSGMDNCATRGPRDGSEKERYPNAYFDNPAYGTAGVKVGWGYRTIPRRGKIHVVYDYLPGHDGDGVVSLRLGENGNDSNPDLTGGMLTGNQVYSWTFNPTVHAGTGGVNYYRTYEYVANDPPNGKGAHGAVLTPHVRLRWTGFVANIRVTVEADSDLDEARWNVDKFDPPVFSPYLVGEVLRDVDTIRLMDWSDGLASGLSDAGQYTPYDYYTWGFLNSGMVGDQGFPLSMGIASITPIAGPQAAALRSTYAGATGGGFPVRVKLDQPHHLADGAVGAIEPRSLVAMTGVSDQDGQVYNARMDKLNWSKPIRVLSPTELLFWLPFDQPGGGTPYGILTRTYTGPELGGATVEVVRRRTLPLRAIGELAAAAGVHVHYSMPYPFAMDTAKAAAWADAVAPHWPPGKELYVEFGNEPWNFYGAYAISVYAAGDKLGLVDGRMPTFEEMFAHHVRLTAQATKVIRQRWAAHGLDPGKVKCLINTGPGFILGYITGAIAEMNNSGDPLLRVDEVACNTYWSNFGDEEDMAAFPGHGGLTVDQRLDLCELRISRGNDPFRAARDQRSTLDNAGLADVALTSYEGGSERLTLGYTDSAAFDPGDPDSQRDCALFAGRQLATFRHPRWVGITQTFFLRLQEIGVGRFTRYLATFQPWPGWRQAGAFPARSWWTSYLSMERAGKGDGTDGLHDNRPGAGGDPFAFAREGDSVSVDAYALKSWNASHTDTNQAPTLVLPASVPAVAVGQPILFQATANDPDPAQALRFGLLPGAPDGATIDPGSGWFRWLPSQPGSWTITVLVTDDGSPPLSASGSISLRVIQKPKFLPRRRQRAR